MYYVGCSHLCDFASLQLVQVTPLRFRVNCPSPIHSLPNNAAPHHLFTMVRSGQTLGDGNHFSSRTLTAITHTLVPSQRVKPLTRRPEKAPTARARCAHSRASSKGTLMQLGGASIDSALCDISSANSRKMGSVTERKTC